MKVSIMQPYFLPYIGYFQLIYNTDQFILLDTVQYIRHGWIERNRIQKQGGGWIYIRVPITKEFGRETRIQNIRIDNTINWKKTILDQLQIYKRKAPYYEPTISMLNKVFENTYINISTLNRDCLNAVLNYLGLKKDIKIFSEMNIEIEEPKAPDEWALNICKAMGVDEYWNPPGGISFFDRNKYMMNNITLRFLKPILAKYDQKNDGFQEGLSIIDVLMFNSKETVINYLGQFEVL